MRTFLFAVIVALTAHCSAAVINFDDVPSGTAVANYYPGVIFSTEAGLFPYAFAYIGPSPFSAPNVLTSFDGVGRSPTSVPDMYADFTTPVNGLTFLAVAADEFGTIARVNVYSGPNLLGTDNITGTAGTPGTFGFGSTLVNLSAYANVTRIEIIPPIGQTDTDSSYGGGGLIYDNFSFDAVPEPTGLCTIALAALCMRRRRRHVTMR